MARQGSSGGRLDVFARIVATGFCFAVFGFAGVTLLLVIAPLLLLVVRDPDRRLRLARTIVHRWFRVFIELMRVSEERKHR